MHEWILDGIGTELIGLAIGCLTGGFTGYRIGIKGKTTQTQKAGNNANQQQSYSISSNSTGSDKSRINSKLEQTQTAGNNANQIQNGGIVNE